MINLIKKKENCASIKALNSFDFSIPKLLKHPSRRVVIILLAAL